MLQLFRVIWAQIITAGITPYLYHLIRQLAKRPLLESNTEDNTIDETVKWDLEVYSETQMLKTKQTGLRGQRAKIQTAGWQEGNYLVRVKYKNEILTAKLLVKR
jgi:hypothetical protein